MDDDETRRNLQLEAAAHVRVQAEIDKRFSDGQLPISTSTQFIRWVHGEFFRDAPEAMLRLVGAGREILMRPGQWRNRSEEDNAVGRHIPPSSEYVAASMRHFEIRYAPAALGKSDRIIAIAAAHHRFNYIQPFPDGNGRVAD